MSAVLTTIITVLVLIPFVGHLIFYVVARWVTENNKRAFLLATDFSTFLFIVAVYYLTIVIWDKSFLLFILLILTVSFLLFIFIDWKTREEIVLPRVLRFFWRFTFLLFFTGYIVLVVYGIINSVTTTLS
ncbi:DUF3397 domain-containing protein [Bacillus sp. HMF5848]|uniref:DUF3397 domain-containing protein n=1 Tax=Bacillus sp. HMF5848 TaxID=2495421 RepID=UPI000F773AE9|nr:DUF3397 domain-containing protein [Bacillus sp. HMF5848]RSK26930.1 DUF3397 domain-containing protein [Bacillus sp. HMF5848]